MGVSFGNSKWGEGNPFPKYIELSIYTTVVCAPFSLRDYQNSFSFKSFSPFIFLLCFFPFNFSVSQSGVLNFAKELEEVKFYFQSAIFLLQLQFVISFQKSFRCNMLFLFFFSFLSFLLFFLSTFFVGHCELWNWVNGYRIYEGFSRKGKKKCPARAKKKKGQMSIRCFR